MPPHEDIIAEDMFNTLTGALIGAGQYRSVYIHRWRDDLVVKVEFGALLHGHNFSEWKNWTDYRDDKVVGPWLARLHWISANGRIVVQDRTSPIRSSEVPAKVPKFIDDLKFSNLGMLGGRLVVHDYAYMNLEINSTLVDAKFDRGVDS